MRARSIITAWFFPGIAGLIAFTVSYWLRFCDGSRMLVLLHAFGLGALIFGTYVAFSEAITKRNVLAYVLGTIFFLGIALGLQSSLASLFGVIIFMFVLYVALACSLASSEPLLWRLWFAVAALVAFFIVFPEALYISLAVREYGSTEMMSLYLWGRIAMCSAATIVVCAGTYLSLSVWRKSRNLWGLLLTVVCGIVSLFALYVLLAMLWETLKYLAGRVGL